MRMTSGSSTVAIAIDQVKKHNWEVATVWIDPQSEKGKISSKETLSLQSRIQSSPESSPVQSPDMSPGFITSPRGRPGISYHVSDVTGRREVDMT